MPPARLATTGRPRQNASITTRPSPSEREGSTSSVARRAPRRRRSGRAARSSSSARAARRASSSTTVALRAAADEVSSRVRHARRGAPPGRGEPVDVLVVLEHADEERRGRVGQRLQRPLAEEAEVHVRGELAPRGSTPVLAHERRSCSRRACARASAWRTPYARERGRRRGAASAAQPRAVEPRRVRASRRARRRSPARRCVASARPSTHAAPSCAPCDDHRVRPEVAQLARDAERQRRA